ncbi:MttA_Hcf106 domain-containing protein [Cephalotus follicularis]|uniref:MttA_Hcf106 domain-containing protein n=1 Tax=Cephalotus follicularis TaxID=3775 RepID=A0A1Q3C6P2_CEPFO|nr:MttA_Hcf106 domain-containing protein [Cephalotus follicularis]
MEILSSITLSLSRPPPPLLHLFSSHSTFFPNKLKYPRSSLVLDRTRTRTEPVRKGLTCNALFGLGVPELVVIAGVVALVFGPKKLPEVGKSIGKTVKSFQQAAKEFETELKREPNSLADSQEEKSIAVNDEEIKVSNAKESV